MDNEWKSSGKFLKEMREDALRFYEDQKKRERELLISLYGVETINDLIRDPHTTKIPISQKLSKIRKERIREVLEGCMGVDHKLQVSLSVKGMQYIDDSSSTNRNGLWFALEMMNKPTVLIMGGQTIYPTAPQIIHDLIREKVRGIVALGKNNEWINDQFSKSAPVLSTSDMRTAIEKANLLANPGDTILLSPAAASFDLFKNYQDRGNQFQKALRNM